MLCFLFLGFVLCFRSVSLVFIAFEIVFNHYYSKKMSLFPFLYVFDYLIFPIIP